MLSNCEKIAHTNGRCAIGVITGVPILMRAGDQGDGKGDKPGTTKPDKGDGGDKKPGIVARCQSALNAHLARPCLAIDLQS